MQSSRSLRDNWHRPLLSRRPLFRASKYSSSSKPFTSLQLTVSEQFDCLIPSPPSHWLAERGRTVALTDVPSRGMCQPETTGTFTQSFFKTRIRNAGKDRLVCSLLPLQLIDYSKRMASPLLQSEADSLRTTPKRLSKTAKASFSMPMAGESQTFQLDSVDGRHTFLIDVNRRGKIRLTRCSYLERYRVVDVLARLDIDGPPHTNPTAAQPPLPILASYNGASVQCPHFHFFVEGYDDRWAVPAAAMGFRQTTDIVLALREFMTHCGVEDVPPMIQYTIV